MQLVSLSIFLRFIICILRQEATSLTKNVRQANVSKNRMMVVALPYQNHAFGDALKLWATTFAA